MHAETDGLARSGREGSQALSREGDLVGQVGREQAGVSDALADSLTCEAMEIHPQAGSREGVQALGEQRSDRTCLAMAGFSNGATATDPSGAAMTVRAPLRTTTWPHSSAAARVTRARAASSATRSPSASGS